VSHRGHERSLDVAQDGHLFPRTEVLDAVARADWRERPVRLIALVCLAAGLVLLALALPIARPMSALDVAWTAGQRAPWLHAPHLLAWVFTRLGSTPEQAWYSVSALGSAAAVPFTYLVARELRVGPLLAGTVAALAAVQPMALLASTLPSAYGFGVAAGSALLLGVLRTVAGCSGPAGVDGSQGLARLGWVCLGAIWLSAEACVLLPGALLAAWSATRDRPARRPAWTAFAILAGLSVAYGCVGVAQRVAELEATEALLLELTWPRMWLALASLPCVLGALLVLMQPGREPEERRAPLWLRAAATAGLLGFALGQVLPLPVLGAPLVPLGLLGLANTLNRVTDPGRAALLAIVAGAFAVAPSIGLQRVARQFEPVPLSRLEAARSVSSDRATAPLTAAERYVARFRWGAPPAPSSGPPFSAGTTPASPPR